MKLRRHDEKLEYAHFLLDGTLKKCAIEENEEIISCKIINFLKEFNNHCNILLTRKMRINDENVEDMIKLIKTGFDKKISEALKMRFIDYRIIELYVGDLAV